MSTVIDHPVCPHSYPLMPLQISYGLFAYDVHVVHPILDRARIVDGDQWRVGGE
jgi:hypothetical protein